MVRTSKFFHSASLLFALIILRSGSCSDDVTPPASPNSKLLILVDQSKSVSYSKNSAYVDTKLLEMFRKTYRDVTAPTEFCIAFIGSEKGVIPETPEFNEPYPDRNALGGSTFDMQLMNWQAKKEKWIKQGINRVKSGLSHHGDRDTDIFTALECVTTAVTSGKKLAKGDKLNIMMFSDMIHSVKGYDFENILLQDAPIESLAKQKFAELYAQKKINKLSPDLLYTITIIGPDEFKKTELLKRYWNTFFTEWGLKDAADWKKTSVE